MRLITPEVIEAWRNADYMALHIALNLDPWERSPLPIEVTALGIDEDYLDPEDRENYKSDLKALKLQKELLAIAGWPEGARREYENNLREAEEWETYCRELVARPGKGGQGTGSDPESRRKALEEAEARVEYRKRLLTGLEAVQAKWAPAGAR
jgi:hypothetical protein